MVLYLGPAAVEALLAIRPEEAVIDAVTPVFNLHPDTIRRRLQQAARAAGLPGWRDITGHSGRVGMAPGPVGCGLRPPRADDGGTVEVSQDAGPLHRAAGSRTGCGGQVLPGRQGVAVRRRSPGSGRQRGGRRFSTTVAHWIDGDCSGIGGLGFGVSPRPRPVQDEISRLTFRPYRASEQPPNLGCCDGNQFLVGAVVAPFLSVPSSDI